MAGNFEGWSDGRPIAKGTGTHFNSLIPITLKRVEPISGGLDFCVRVKVSKVKE